MPPRVNKKLLMIIVGSMLVLTVGLTVWYWLRSRGEVQQAAGRQEARDLIERGQMRRAMFTLEELVRQRPEDVQSRIELAKVYAQQNELGKAYNQWRTVLRYDMNNLEAWQQVGRFVSQSRQWNELEAAAQHILELSRDNPEGLLYMAQACLGLGSERVPDALEYARRAVDAGPRNAQAHLTLARVHLVRGDDDEVRKAVDDALVQLPESQEVWQFLGQYEAELARRAQVKRETEQIKEHRAKAEEAFAKALEHADNPVNGHLQLAHYYNGSGKKDEAEKHFEEACRIAQTQEEKLTARRAYGDFCAQERRWDDALKHYGEALIAWPKHREILVKKARICLTENKGDEAKLALDEVKNQGRRDIFHVQALHLNGFRLLSAGRHDEAIEELSAALTMVRDSGVELDTSDMQLILARAYTARGDVGTAVEVLQDAHARFPRSARVLLDLARMHYARREYDQVIELLGESAQRPYEGHLLLARALIARGAEDDLRKAREQLEALRERRPDKEEIHVELGRLAFRTGEFDRAVGHFDDAVKVAPTDVTGHLAKAVTLERAKRTAEAEQTFADAVKALPDDVRLRFEFARFLDRQKQFERGERLLLDEVNRREETDRLRDAFEGQLPRYYLAAGHVDKALAWYRAKADKDPKDVQTRQLIVQLALSQRDFDTARATIGEIRKVRPDDSAVVLLLEGQYLVSERKYAEGLAKLLVAEREKGGDPDLLYYIGLCYLRTNKAPEARGYMERVARRFPQNPRVQRALAEIYYSLGELNQAKELVDELRAVGQAGWSLDVIEATSLTRTGEAEEGEKVWHNIIRRDPDRSEGYVGLFDALWRQGKRTEALEALTKAHELDGKSFRTTWSLANVHILDKNYVKAIEVTRDALEVEANRDNLALLGLLARLHDLANDESEAQQVYDRIRKIDPANPLPAIAAGDRALARRDLPATETAYREALRLRPENRIVRMRLVEVLTAQNKVDAAHEVLDGALVKTPDDIGLRLVKARLYRAGNRPEDAIREYNDAVRLTREQNRPKDAFIIHYELGQMHLERGNRAEARANFELARNLRPDFLEARRQLVLLSRSEGQDFEARLECLAILQNRPDLLAYLTLGDMAAERRNWKEARKHYDEAVEKFPAEPLPHSKRAMVLAATDDAEGAITELKKALEIDGYSPRSLGPLVNALVGRKRHDEALTFAREALKKIPEREHVAVYGMMGEVEASREQFDRARGHFDQALKLDPKNPVVYLSIARTHLVEKNPDLAIAKAREALTLDETKVPGGVYIFLEAVYTQEKRHEELRALYQEWLRRDPGSVRAVNNYAWHLIEVADEPARALQEIRTCRDLWRQAGRDMPFQPELDDTQGRAHYQLKQYREAVDLFKRSLTSRPKSARTWEHLRLTYVKLLEKARAEGDTYAVERYEIEAREAFEKVREHSPATFESQAQLGDMKLADGRFKEAIEAYENALKMRKDPDVQRKLAELLIRDDRTEHAEPLVMDLVAADPDLPLNLVLQGFLYARQGKSREATDVLEKVTTDHPDLLMGHYILAQQYIARGDVDKANASLEKAIALDKTFLGARLIKARLLAATNKVDEAVTEFQNIVQDNPASFDAAYEMGNLLLLQKRLPEATRLFESMKQKWPNSVAAQERLALAYHMGNQTGKALLEYRDARLRNPSALLLVRGLVSVLQTQGKFDEAVTEYRRYLEDNPRATQGWLDLAGLYGAKERFDDVERCLNEAIRVSPNSIEVRRALFGFYMGREQFDKARLAGRRMIMDLPTSIGRAVGYTTVAQAFEREKKYDEAITEYKNAIKEDDRHVEAVNNLAWLYVTQKRDYAEAIRLAEPYVEKYPRFPELLDTVGWAHLMNGDAKKAEPLLKQALATQQARDRRVLVEIAYHYGEALYRNGKLKEAKEVLEPVSRVQFPQSDRVKEILSKMK